jgi:hypothetical protein
VSAISPPISHVTVYDFAQLAYTVTDTVKALR